jgi:hypothetical protein
VRDEKEPEPRTHRAAARHPREQRLRRFRPGLGRMPASPVPAVTSSVPGPALGNEVHAIEHVLDEHGPTHRRELARLVGARYWGPGVLAQRCTRRLPRAPFGGCRVPRSRRPTAVVAAMIAWAKTSDSPKGADGSFRSLLAAGSVHRGSGVPSCIRQSEVPVRSGVGWPHERDHRPGRSGPAIAGRGLASGRDALRRRSWGGGRDGDDGHAGAHDRARACGTDSAAGRRPPARARRAGAVAARRASSVEV